MPGPKIVGSLPVETPSAKPRARETGVRPVKGGYVAVRNGRFAGEFHGSRAFLAAARAAGSSERLS